MRQIKKLDSLIAQLKQLNLTTCYFTYLAAANSRSLTSLITSSATLRGQAE